MSINLKHIAEGWFNVLLSKLDVLDEEKKEISKSRIAICLDCPVRDGNRCDPTKTHISAKGQTFHGCGCRIEAKTLCMDCHCPGEFW